MKYEELLKRAIAQLPKKIERKERFEMPKVVIEYSGNKTLLRNFKEILSILRREPRHLSKYLFKELAAPGTIQNDILIFQSKISKEILQKKIENYVKEFVFCKICGKPDTQLIKEDRLTFMRCEACGAKSSVRSI